MKLKYGPLTNLSGRPRTDDEYAEAIRSFGLIRALEKAPRGTRALSCRVLLAFGWTKIDNRNKEHDGTGCCSAGRIDWLPPGQEEVGNWLRGSYESWRFSDCKRVRESWQRVPDPARSLDAAQSLVEPCHMVTLRFETPDEGSDTMASAEITFTAEDPRFYGVSATPAPALCIAALKARQATSFDAPPEGEG